VNAEREKLRALGKETRVVNVATAWDSDDTVEACVICSERFTFIKRRHHCRKCGRVICGNCSQKRILVPAVDAKKPTRVCDKCYDEDHDLKKAEAVGSSAIRSGSAVHLVPRSMSSLKLSASSASSAEGDAEAKKKDSDSDSSDSDD